MAPKCLSVGTSHVKLLLFFDAFARRLVADLVYARVRFWECILLSDGASRDVGVPYTSDSD
jgi:hypothetical protein